MSSPVLSDDSEISSPLSGLSMSGHLRSQSLMNKDLKKTRKIFKNVDKEIDRIRRQNESIVVSTIIENNPEESEQLDDSETEFQDEDHLLIPNSESDFHYSTKYASFRKHRLAYGICCGVISFSVLLILWVGKLEFNLIEGHHFHNSS